MLSNTGSWFVLLVGVCNAVVDHAIDNQTFTHRREVSEKITVEWQFVSNVIIFRVTAMTKGWIGVGISLYPSMEGADLMLAGVADGSVYVWDAYSSRNGLPALDQDQYVDILSGSENETHTTVTILRRRETFHPEDLTVEFGGSYFLLWAFGQRDITGRSVSFRDYHRRNRGYFDLLFPTSRDDETTTQNYSVISEATPQSLSGSGNPTTPQTTTQSRVTETVSINSNSDEGDATSNRTSVQPETAKTNNTYKFSAAFAFAALILLMVVAKRRLASLTS